ncbi:MAG TPA: DUF2975 domain-containing protein [Allosphingosinicella sp.]|nr:DUF2975 domain-containing protein [Allosphingosinicella sp.]
MTSRYGTALSASRAALRVLIVLNVAFGLGILALLVASLAAPGWTMAALGARVDVNPALLAGGRALMVVGLCSVPLAHIVLSRLLAMVETVRRGDPFVADNAVRLNRIAWALLGLETLHLVAGIVAAAASTPAAPFDIDWNFSVTGWLAVLLLFVLARVFAEGARMRDDLEGTV